MKLEEEVKELPVPKKSSDKSDWFHAILFSVAAGTVVYVGYRLIQEIGKYLPSHLDTTPQIPF